MSKVSSRFSHRVAMALTCMVSPKTRHPVALAAGYAVEGGHGIAARGGDRGFGTAGSLHVTQRIPVAGSIGKQARTRPEGAVQGPSGPDRQCRPLTFRSVRDSEGPGQDDVRMNHRPGSIGHDGRS
ncbi:MAG: hypothetical protein ACOVME_09035 [Rhodobacter sp.]